MSRKSHTSSFKFKSTSHSFGSQKSLGDLDITVNIDLLELFGVFI